MADDIQAAGPADGEALWFGGGLARIVIPAAATDDTLAVIEQRGSRGFAAPVHRQPADPESFHVLSGEVTFYTGAESEPLPAPAGTTVHIPAGVTHALRVTSDEARFLVMTTAQHERFFRAASEPAPKLELPPPGPPNMEQLLDAAQRHQVEILGPPPGGTEDGGT